jgi:hypothetical protein
VSGRSSRLTLILYQRRTLSLSRHVGSVRWLVARGFFSLWNEQVLLSARAAGASMYKNPPLHRRTLAPFIFIGGKLQDVCVVVCAAREDNVFLDAMLPKILILRSLVVFTCVRGGILVKNLKRSLQLVPPSRTCVCGVERGRPKIQNVKSTIKALAGWGLFAFNCTPRERTAFGMITFYSP